MIGFLFPAIVFIGVLSVLVLVHEIGHYGAARLLGVRVRELGVGFPPRVRAINRGGIDYSINALPFGGFVRLHGEEDTTQPDGFAGRSIKVRTAIIVSGAAMNLALAWVIFTVIAAVVPVPTDVIGDVVVRDVAAGSPAESAGILPDDLLDELNGVEVVSSNQLSLLIRETSGQQVTLRVLRGLVPIAIQLVPRVDPPSGEGAMGISISMENATLLTERNPLWRAPIVGVRTMIGFFGLVAQEVRGWGSRSSQPDFAGPVGIAQIMGEAARSGFLDLIWLVGVLSLNLAVFNLLPVPALDGGRLPFLALEAIRGGRRLSARLEGTIHFVGFAVLIGLILLVTIAVDIPRVFSGDPILPPG